MAKWAIKLSEFDIAYRPRTAFKAQILADFVVECTIPERTADSPTTQNPPPAWILHVDDASNMHRSGARLVLTNADGLVTEYALRFSFHASNNQAEYEALVAGIRLAKELGITHLRAFSDSQLVVEQVKGDIEARDPTMKWYLQKLQTLISSFKLFEICYIPKDENSHADLLSKLATSASDLLG